MQYQSCKWLFWKVLKILEKPKKMRKKRYAFGVTLLTWLSTSMFLLCTETFAKTEVIYANHKSVMGDNDSKNDVRRMCFLEAKRKVLEKAGTYIESQTEVMNLHLTRDEITIMQVLC